MAPGVSIAQEEPPPERRIADLRAEVARHPDHDDAWQRLGMEEAMLAASRVQTDGSAATNSAVEEATRRVCGEWARVRPRSWKAKLCLAQIGRPPADRPRILLALAEELPEQLDLQQIAAQIEAGNGDLEAATRRIEEFAQRNPDDSAAWQALADQYQRAGRKADAESLLLDWATRSAPEWPVLGRWLTSPQATTRADVTATLVDRLWAGDRFGAEAIEPCRQLARVAGGTFRPRAEVCLERVVSAATDADTLRRSAAALAGLLAPSGRAADLDSLLEPLPAAARARALLAAAIELRSAGECGEAWPLVEGAAQSLGQPSVAGVDSALWSDVTFELGGCASYTRAAEHVTRFLEIAPTETLDPIVTAWTNPVNGEWSRPVPYPDGVAALERRLQRAPRSVVAWRALWSAYASNGLMPDARRLAEEWLARGPLGQPAAVIRDLASGRLEIGDHDGAIDRLKTYIRREGANRNVVETLVRFELAAGLPTEAAAVRDYFAYHESRETLQPDSRLYAAEIAAAAGDLVTAESELSEYFRRGGSDRVAAERLLLLRRTLDPAADLAPAAIGLCAAPDLRGDSLPIVCAAGLLAASGAIDAALAALEGALATGVGAAELLESLAAQAVRAERWEIAERATAELVASAPNSISSWTLWILARAHADDPAVIDEAAARAERALGERPTIADLELARIAILRGDPRSGLDLLLPHATTITGWLPERYWAEVEAGYQKLAVAVPRSPRDPKPDALFAEAVRDLVAERPEGLEPTLAHLQTAAAAGSCRAAVTASWLHGAGIGSAPDSEQVARWRERAAQLGCDGYYLVPGAFAADDSPERRFFERSLAELIRRAGDGHAAARGVLASAYMDGIGVPPDRARSLELAELAAAHGDREAMRLLARGHAGFGYAIDMTRSAEWLSRCADLGNSFCAMWLSQALRSGEGIERDLAEADRWLEAAARAGNWWALHDLANYAEWGWGARRPPDPTLAADCRRALARTGDEVSRGWLLYRNLSVD